MEIKENIKVPTSENSRIFHQGMYDRMCVSYFKYGKISDAYPDKINAIDSLKLRIKKYLETSNTEFLMDVANFAMIEFMHPSLPDAYFKPTDDKESPGRIWNETGEASKKGNK